MSTKKELQAKKKVLGGKDLRAKLLADDAFKKYRRILKDMKSKYDLQAIIEEAHGLHAGRLSRTLKGTNPGTQKVSEAALSDGSNRSRMTLTYVRLGLAYDILDIAVSAAKTHILSEYSDSMPNLRTKGERSDFLDSFVGSGVRFMAETKAIQKALEFYIKDIDQMHFQLKLAADMLKLTTDKNKEI